jgi:hypothetical protein
MESSCHHHESGGMQPSAASPAKLNLQLSIALCGSQQIRLGQGPALTKTQAKSLLTGVTGPAAGVVAAWLDRGTSWLNLTFVPGSKESIRISAMLKTWQQASLVGAMALVLACTSTNASKAFDKEPWVDCLYNKKSMTCRRIFACKTDPCNQFSLEWKDGVKDTYKRFKDGVVSNVGFYRDTRGGTWMLRGFGYPFGLVNEANGNTIIYGMTLEQCQSSFGLSDLCGKKFTP